MKIKPFRFKHQGSSLTLVLREELQLPAKGCYLITGKSGLGKSTFLQLLKGFYPEFLSGELEGDLEFFSNSHYLFQNPFSQIIHPKALSEFLFSMENKIFSREKMQEKMLLMESFRLENMALKETSQLSHGECQRLLLSSLVASEPDWLFLDEPTAFIDQSMRQYIYEQLGNSKKEIGILIIDHHLDEVESICDGFFELVLLPNESNGADQLVEIRFQLNNNIPKPEVQKNDNDQFSWQLSSKKHSSNLIVKGLTFGYQKDNVLFSDVGFTLNAGEVVTLIGPSGVGKSTILKLLLFELKKQLGEISWQIAGEKIPAKRIFDYVALLFQNPENHFLFDTVEEELNQFYQTDKKELVEKLLEKFKLKHLLFQSPYLLSEGQKRRLSLIITLLLDRPFLLLDEPSFGQDQEQVYVIQQFIRDLKKQGVAVLMVSHDPSFYHEISDRIITLARRVEDGE